MSKFDLFLAASYSVFPAVAVLLINKFSMESLAGIFAGISLGLFASMLVIYKLGNTLKK